jgi:hypothetical protein
LAVGIIAGARATLLARGQAIVPVSGFASRCKIKGQCLTVQANLT